MPLSGIRLLFETLVQRTRVMCKCEMCENGSKDCNLIRAFSREPLESAPHISCCIAKSLTLRAERWTARAALLNPPP